MEIREFQQLIRDIYFQKDNQRGVQGTFLWFVEEVGELAEAIGKYKQQKQESFKENIALEIADIFAWGTSIANLLDIDIEQAIKKKYPNHCLKCKSHPCICDTKELSKE
ncbi:MAG: MazG nucleotide pyrophosphohydrolase domain-containing protein [Promethearchaeota archaeon]